MKKFILFLLSIPAIAQTNITVSPNALTALLDFDSPSAGEDCTVDLTYQESSPGTPNWSNLVPWSDRTLFTSLSIMPKGFIHRRKILGGEPFNVRLSTDGVNGEQMGLPNSTKIYGRIICGVRSAVTFQFNTRVYPQGFTYGPKITLASDYSGSQYLPANHLDIRDHITFNRYGNIEQRFDNVDQLSRYGIFDPNTEAVGIGDPVPAGGGSWTAPSGSLSAGGSYLIYDGTSQEKCYIPASKSTGIAYRTVNWQTLTLTGCSGTASPVTLNACRTNDGTTCIGAAKTFPLPAGSFSSCSSPSTVTQPGGSPLWDMWQTAQYYTDSTAGFLVWASTNAATRILIDSASSNVGLGFVPGGSFGGFSNYFSPHTTNFSADNSDRYIMLITGNNGAWPIFYAYDPIKKRNDFLGIAYKASINWDEGYNTVAWSHFQPNSFYAMAGDLEQIYVNTTLPLPVAPNANANLGIKPLIANFRQKVSDFYTANQSHYPGTIFDVSQAACSTSIQEVTYRNGFDYLIVACQLLAGDQDAWKWLVAVQIDPNKDQSESANTKVVGIFIPYASKASRYMTTHSVFVGRGKKSVVNLTAASPKDAVNFPSMRMRVAAGSNLTSSGGTTLVLYSPCSGSGIYYPCSETVRPNTWIADIQQGDRLLLEANFECAYVNSASLNPTTHLWTVNVSRNWCTDEGNNDIPYGMKNWNTDMSVVMIQSFTGISATAHRQDFIRPAWDYLRDPYGEKLLTANYASSSHDYCFKNFIGGGGGSAWQAGPGVSACEDAMGKGSNIGVEWRLSRWAGTRSYCDGDNCEDHPSQAQEDAKGINNNFQIDGLPAIGGDGATGAVVKYIGSGQSNLYKLTSINGRGILPPYDAKPNYKASGFFVSRGTNGIFDISGPSATIDDTKPLTMCKPYHANECVAGSTVGEVYLELPGLNYTTCMGGEFHYYFDDVCPANINSSWDAMSQIGIVDYGKGNVGHVGESAPTAGDHTGADHIRPITDQDVAYRVKSSGWNARTDPSGTALLSAQVRGGRPMLAMTFMPPFGLWDGHRRDQPIEFAVKVTVPSSMAAAHNAIVEFGYGPELYCVGQRANTAWDGRSERCAKGTQPIQWYDEANKTLVGNDVGKNFDFESDEPTMTGVSCTAGSSCTVTIPVIPLRPVWYRWKIRNSSNTVLFTSHACTNEQDCMITIPY